MTSVDTTLLRTTARRLKRLDSGAIQALIGFDGFIDEIAEVVDRRSSATEYKPLATIAAFAERVQHAAGLSANLELVSRRVKLGGSAALLADALLESGLKVTFVGAAGRAPFDPAFSSIVTRAKACHSLADPGRTLALEFRDGKLMLNRLENLNAVTYERLVEVVGIEALRELWSECRLVAFANWTMLPNAGGIWRGLLRDMVGVEPPASAALFVDLSDPEKRAPEDLADACRLLASFERSHRVTLGLNQKESVQVGTALGCTLAGEELEENAVRLRSELGLSAIAIHAPRAAACASSDGSAHVTGPYCERPALTTGAGDNFNAGFCLALLAGLTNAERLAAATASAGFYVRQGRSASLPELRSFLGAWADHYDDPRF
jgi:hypothetical protein